MTRPADEPELRLAFLDPFVAVVDKPAGVVVHRGWGDDARPVLQRLRDQLGRHVHPVHRLDRPTSGALLFALTPEDTRTLQAQFDAGTVEKRYVALCRGTGVGLARVDHALKDPEDGTVREAVTDFRWLGASGRYGLVEARPITGRPHQIRRHLKHLACPIIGDVRYGKGEHNRLFRDNHGLHRLALHCFELGFDHPRDGRRLRVRAPVPADFASVIEALGLGAEAASAGIELATSGDPAAGIG